MKHISRCHSKIKKSLNQILIPLAQYFMDTVYSYSIYIGVPQGSVLDPSFFVLYTNDLPNSVEKQNMLL